MKILNLTQHIATPDQIEAGVFEPTPEHKIEIQKLLTFDEIPIEMTSRTISLLHIVKSYNTHHVMIGGAPYLMSTLERWLKHDNITPMYAFSIRENTEIQTANGTEKRSIFKHIGFVEV